MTSKRGRWPFILQRQSDLCLKMFQMRHKKICKRAQQKKLLYVLVIATPIYRQMSKLTR